MVISFISFLQSYTTHQMIQMSLKHLDLSTSEMDAQLHHYLICTLQKYFWKLENPALCTNQLKDGTIVLLKWVLGRVIEHISILTIFFRVATVKNSDEQCFKRFIVKCVLLLSVNYVIAAKLCIWIFGFKCFRIHVDTYFKVLTLK